MTKKIISKGTIKSTSHKMISYHTYEIQKNESRIKEEIKELLKDEKTLKYLAIVIPVIIFLFQAYISWNISVRYGVPIDSIKINTKAPSLLIF